MKNKSEISTSLKSMLFGLQYQTVEILLIVQQLRLASLIVIQTLVKLCAVFVSQMV